MLASMDHPESYNNRASCQWNIRVPTEKNIYLHLSNFSLEETTLCFNDEVTLSDNVGTLGTYCTSPPRDLVTAGDTLTISFSSNDKIVDTGFSAIWKAVDPADIEAAVGCGGHFTSQQGALRSPTGPMSTRARRCAPGLSQFPQPLESISPSLTFNCRLLICWGIVWITLRSLMLLGH